MTAIHLTVHENAADFLAAAGAFLNLSEAENSMVSISAARMVSGPTGDDADTYLASVEHEGAVVAAALAGLAVAPLARRIAPPGLVDIGPAQGLPRLGVSKVMLHSKVSDPVKLAALRTLAATFRSVAKLG